MSASFLFSIFKTETLSNDNITLQQIKQLLENQHANVNETNASSDNFLQTLIYEECLPEDAKERESIVIYLVEHGLDINYQNRHGWSALHAAVAEDQFEIARLLIKHGASKTLVNESGNTAYDILNKFVPSYMSDSYRQRRQEVLNDLLLPVPISTTEQIKAYLDAQHILLFSVPMTGTANSHEQAQKDVPRVAMAVMGYDDQYLFVRFPSWGQTSWLQSDAEQQKESWRKFSYDEFNSAFSKYIVLPPQS